MAANRRTMYWRASEGPTILLDGVFTEADVPMMTPQLVQFLLRNSEWNGIRRINNGTDRKRERGKRNMVHVVSYYNIKFDIFLIYRSL